MFGLPNSPDDAFCFHLVIFCSWLDDRECNYHGEHRAMLVGKCRGTEVVHMWLLNWTYGSFWDTRATNQFRELGHGKKIYWYVFAVSACLVLSSWLICCVESSPLAEFANWNMLRLVPCLAIQWFVSMRGISFFWSCILGNIPTYECLQFNSSQFCDILPKFTSKIFSWIKPFFEKGGNMLQDLPAIKNKK